MGCTYLRNTVSFFLFDALKQRTEIKYIKFHYENDVSRVISRETFKNFFMGKGIWCIPLYSIRSSGKLQLTIEKTIKNDRGIVSNARFPPSSVSTNLVDDKQDPLPCKGKEKKRKKGNRNQLVLLEITQLFFSFSLSPTWFVSLQRRKKS